MIRASGEVQAADGLFEQVSAGGVECAEPVDFLDAKLVVGFALTLVLSLKGLTYKISLFYV